MKEDHGKVTMRSQSGKRVFLLMPCNDAAQMTGYSEAGLKGSYEGNTEAEIPSDVNTKLHRRGGDQEPREIKSSLGGNTHCIAAFSYLRL